MTDRSDLYVIPWDKYRSMRKQGLESFYSYLSNSERHLRRTFHTCPVIMAKKKELEELVRDYDGRSKDLVVHFQTPYKERKVNFYQKIVYDILKEERNDMERMICEITKDILFIYATKKEEMEYVDWQVNSMEAEISHREEMRESMMDDFRNCD